MANHCDYCRYLEGKGLLEQYRDHVASRGRNSMFPEQTRWSGAPWPFAEEDYVDVVTGREILRAIEARPADRPFCIFGSFCGPHKPYDPPATFLDAAPADDETAFLPGAGELDEQTRTRLRAVRRAYRAMISCIDAQVGLVLDALEREGLLDSTVILFTSDHGEMLGDHNRMSKMQPWRESVVVPTAIRHPAYLDQRTCRSLIEITDLTATMLDIAGQDPQTALSKPWPAFHDRVPCRSLMPIVRGEADTIRRYAFSECMGVWQMVQTEDWKYVRYLNQSPEASAGEELYHLAADPGEQQDLSAEVAHAAILAELREQRDRILDASPPAQTGWAPYAG
jgi:choline-sulfatase